MRAALQSKHIPDEKPPAWRFLGDVRLVRLIRLRHARRIVKLAAETADNGTEHDQASHQDDPARRPDCGFRSFILRIFDLEFCIRLRSSTNVHGRRFPPLQRRDPGYTPHHGLHGQAAPQPESWVQSGSGSRACHAAIGFVRPIDGSVVSNIEASDPGRACRDRNNVPLSARSWPLGSVVLHKILRRRALQLE